MVFGLGKKRKRIPVDLVRVYAKQGMTDSQIERRLTNQGFSKKQIADAMRIAIRDQVRRPAERRPMHREEPPRREMPPREVPVPREMPRPPREMVRPPQRRIPETPTMGPPGRMPIEHRPGPTIREVERPAIPRHPEPMHAEPRAQYPESIRYGIPPERILPPSKIEIPEKEPTTSDVGKINVEEIVEGVVAEKWGEFEKRLSNFEKRDLQLQNQIENLRKKTDELEKLIMEREKSLLTKFEDFGGSMEEIQGRIGSIERIFKDFIPQLSDNIRLMSEVVEGIKKKKK